MIKLNAKGKEFVYHHHLPDAVHGLAWVAAEGRPLNRGYYDELP